jgi:acetoin utilization deacetylase AcuC-like enzyme
MKGEKIGSCGSGRVQFLKNFENRILPALRAFKPELIILSAGFDAGKDDVGNMKLDTGSGGIDLTMKDYETLTNRFQDVAKMCGHNKIVSCLEGGYGRWVRGKNGATVLDRSLLAENVSSHVHSLVGVHPLRERKLSRSKREGKKSS